MNTLIAAIRPRLLTVAVWALIILALFGLVSYNRATQARLEASLASPDQSVRDATVRQLIDGGRLIDVLTNTQNPNEDKDSLQNKRSLEVRKNAVASVNRLTEAHQISDAQAFNNLFLLCKDGSDDVKNPAKDELAKLASQSDANLHVLVQHLSDGDPDIRGASVDALGRQINGALVLNGDKAARAVDAVIKDQAAQDSAESALVKIGAPAVPYLLAHVGDPDLTFRQGVVDHIGQIGAGATAAVGPLTQVAAHDEAAVRRTALISLANIVLAAYKGQRQYSDDLAAYTAKRKTDPTAKPPALGDIPKQVAAVQPAEPTLSAALADAQTDSEARAQSALALGFLATAGGPNGANAVATLVKALGDYDQRVAQAAQAGAQTAGPPAVAPLVAVLGGHDPQAQGAAAEALGGIGDPAALAALQAAFARPTTPDAVRQRAVQGLGTSSNVAVVPTLVRALGDTNGNVASAASASLDNAQFIPTAVPLLVAALTQPTPVPFNASQALGDMARSDDRVVPALEKALVSPNPQVQTWVAVALGMTETKDKNAVDALNRLKTSANPSVQWASSQALDRLASS